MHTGEWWAHVVRSGMRSVMIWWVTAHVLVGAALSAAACSHARCVWEGRPRWTETFLQQAEHQSRKGP